MQIRFKNLSPLVGEYQFDFTSANFILNQDDRVIKAIANACGMMQWVNMNSFEGPAKHVNPLTYIRNFMTNISKPICIGYKRDSLVGVIDGQFEFSWNEEKQLGYVSSMSFRIDDEKIFERTTKDAYLHLDGVQSFVEKYIAMESGMEEDAEGHERFISLLFNFEEDESLSAQLASRSERVIHRKLEDFDPTDIRRITFRDNESHVFFSNEGERELNRHVECLLFQLSYQIPFVMYTNFFKWSVNEATTFAQPKKRDMSDSLSNFYTDKHIEKACVMLKSLGIPKVKFQPILDDRGFYLSDAFVYEDELGGTQNILNLSVEDQALIHVFIQMVAFEKFTAGSVTLFDEARLIDLSNLDLFLSPERMNKVYKILRKEFPKFRFLFGVKRMSVVSEMIGKGNKSGEARVVNCKWNNRKLVLSKHEVESTGKLNPSLESMHYLNGIFLN